MRQDARIRRERIIETVVPAFIKSGRPVNSAYVATHSGLGLKAASVRAIMKELEADGYLSQPHTSAGRVPTPKCYRYYVAKLMPSTVLSPEEKTFVREAVDHCLKEHDARLFLHHMANVISELSDLVGVALAPSVDDAVFDRIEIADLGGSSILLVISLTCGMVNTIRITLDSIVPRQKHADTARLISDRLHGLSISELRDTLELRLKDVAFGDRRLVEIIVERRNRLFDFMDSESVHVSGLTRALAQPEFSDHGYSLKLASMIEDTAAIERAIRQAERGMNGVSVTIGGNGPWGADPALSLISADLYSGISGGALGIIGPARADYPRLTALVHYAAGLSSRFFTES